MPLRLPNHNPFPASGNQFENIRIYQHCDWGQLARFHIVDDRQYRSHHACPRPGHGGANVVSHSTCPALIDTTRTLLGDEQEQWLHRSFVSSKAKWNILTQQTLMAQVRYVGSGETDGKFWTDGWDGYQAARHRVLRDIHTGKVSNPVVISGDVHSFLRQIYALILTSRFPNKIPSSQLNFAARPSPQVHVHKRKQIRCYFITLI